MQKQNDMTAVKVRKSTVAVLKTIAETRGRRESMEQIILELVDLYMDKVVRNAQ